MKSTDLPTFPLKLFKWFCRPEYHDDIEGDLLELYAKRLKTVSRKKAGWALLLDVLLLFRPGIIRPLQIDIPFIPISMYKNYLKVAWRNLMAQKLYAFINVGGLSLGLSAFLVIILYVQHETSYDRFLPDSENIYRVYQRQEGNEFLGSDFFSVTPAHLAVAMKEELPEVEAATTFNERRALIGYDGDFYWEEGIVANESFFKVFPFKRIAGDLDKALARPNTIVLSRSLALKLFYNLDIIGEQLTLNEKNTFTVTAVVADPPVNSSLTFSYISALTSGEQYSREVKEQNWQNNGYQTFFRIYDKAGPEQIETKLAELYAKYKELDDYPFKDTYFIQPLHELHLETKANFDVGKKGNPTYVRLFSWIAIIVLILACINYVNLAIARSIKRTREVGLRKVIGAKRSQLMGQFLGESILITSLSLLFALIIAYLALPVFGEIVGAPLSLELFVNPWLIPGLIGLLLLVGITSGLYPAVLLSAFLPSNIFKSEGLQKIAGFQVQKLLVVAQYGASITLVICSIVIYQQFQFIQKKELGYNKEHIVVIPVNFRDVSLNKAIPILKQRWMSNPNIFNISISRDLPTKIGSSSLIDGFSDSTLTDELAIYRTDVDYNFLDLYEIELMAGRNFSKDYSQEENRYLFNESAVKALGWTNEEAIGQRFSYNGEGEIIGVIKDFHMHDMHMEIQPLMLSYTNSYYRNIGVKVSPENLPETLAFLEESYKEFSSYPFTFSFLDDEFQQLYSSDLRLGKIFGFFTLLSILIGALGLFGLAAVTAKQRTKEIGIRKVLGASTQQIVSLLSYDFILLLGVGFILAVPISWYSMSQWLGEFAYRISIEWWIFALAGMLAIVLAILTVSSQSFQAARLNPVDSLRAEG